MQGMPLLTSGRRMGPVIAGLVALTASWASAAGMAPSEKVFPQATLAWVSVRDPQELRDRFDRSPYGRLIADPAMKTFVDSLKEQVAQNGKQRLAKLGLTLDDLAEVVGGEIAAAAIQPEGGRMATVLVVDTTGHEEQARALLKTLDARLLERKAEKVAVPGAPPELVVYQLPPSEDERDRLAPRERRVAFALAASALVVGDDAVQVGQAFAVLDQGRADSLLTLDSFKAVESRCAPAVPAAAAPLRWFIKPLPFAAAWREANPPREKRKGPDYVAILGRQGFDAVQAAGGLLVFSEGAHAMRHHSFVYAPPLAGRDPESVDRYDRAARMLRFPTAADIAPPDWVPQDVGGWTALQWDLQTAFTVVETLVDDIVGDTGVYDDVIASLKEDPDGPQIDVQKDLVDCLDGRITVLNGHVEPLGTDSDRIVFAIKCSDEARVAATIAKVMNADADMQKVELGGQAAWELIDRSHAIPKLEVETPGGAVTHADDEDEGAARRQRLRDKDEKLLPHSTVAVARGHLLIASHRDILERLLTAEGGPDQLGAADDYKAMVAEMARYASGETAARSFGREDVSIRPTYELLRQGSMPKAQSVFGQLMNGVLGDGKPGTVREQQIDGSTLPEFEVVRKYFGTVGTALEAFPDGWRLTGLALPRAGQADPEVARTPSTDVGR